MLDKRERSPEIWKQVAINEAAMAIVAVNFPDLRNIEFVCSALLNFSCLVMLTSVITLKYSFILLSFFAAPLVLFLLSLYSITHSTEIA